MGGKAAGFEASEKGRQGVGKAYAECMAVGWQSGQGVAARRRIRMTEASQIRS